MPTTDSEVLRYMANARFWLGERDLWLCSVVAATITLMVRGGVMLPAARTGMRVVKRSIHLEAPVEMVFDSFKDPARFVDLDPGGTQVDEVKVTKEGVGTYMSWHAKIVGLPIRGFEVLTDVVPNKHITSRSSNAVVGTWDYDFEPEGSGTKLTLEHHLGSFWRIPPLRNLMDLATERLNDTYMARVKDAIETQGT